MGSKKFKGFSQNFKNAQSICRELDGLFLQAQRESFSLQKLLDEKSKIFSRDSYKRLTESWEMNVSGYWTALFNVISNSAIHQNYINGEWYSVYHGPAEFAPPAVVQNPPYHYPANTVHALTKYRSVWPHSGLPFQPEKEVQ